MATAACNGQGATSKVIARNSDVIAQLDRAIQYSRDGSVLIRDVAGYWMPSLKRGMTAGMTQHSRGVIAPELYFIFRASDMRGRREGRVSTDTRGPRALRKARGGTTASAG